MRQTGVRMKALTELCDILAENNAASIDGFALLWNQCPSLESFSQGGLYLKVRQTNALLAVARYLSRAQHPEKRKEALFLILEFITSVPKISRNEAWPVSFTLEGFDIYFGELLDYLADMASKWPEITSDISKAFTRILMNIIEEKDESTREPQRWNRYVAVRSLLAAIAKQFPATDGPDAEALAQYLLQHWLSLPPSPLELPGRSVSERSSASRYFSSSPDGNSKNMKDYKIGQGYLSDFDSRMPNSAGDSPKYGINAFFTPNSTPRETPEGEGDATGSVLHLNDNGSRVSSNRHGESHEASERTRHLLIALEGEPVEALEQQELGFRLFVQVLKKAELQEEFISQLRAMASGHLGALLPLLKIRKREWPVDGLPLLAKMNMKLQASQAAAVVTTMLLKAESEGRPSKTPLDGESLGGSTRETLALLMDAADACMGSPWRRLKSCESLFGALLSGVSETGALQGNHMLRILLMRIKGLVLATCAQADTSSTNQGPVFVSVAKAACRLIEASWNLDRATSESFLLSLAAHVRERLKQEKKEKQTAAATQLNVIPFLANVAVLLNKAEAVDLIMPLFVESLEEGDASAPSLVRLRVLEAVARMACLGCEKSYREVVVLLTVSYIKKLSLVGLTESRTLAPEATTERLETLPGAFLHIAQGLKEPKLRSDYRQRLLVLCSDVSLVAESKNGRNGADFLGPLLPAVAEICSDLEPIQDVDSLLQKLFRNLWFYIVLYGLAPPLQKVQPPTSCSRPTSSCSRKNLSVMQTIAGSYMWNVEWSNAINRLTQSTPPLVVTSVKWLEDEVELIALYNPGSKRGSGNERAAAAQRNLLSAALGGQVDVASLSSISGVKATYLLGVAFLEVLRLSHNGGVVKRDSADKDQISLLTCAFKYLESPNLPTDLHQCLTAIVHRAFDAALTWLEGKVATSGSEVVDKEIVLACHACFLIKNETHGQEAVRELADSLLSQLRNRFPQVLWNGQCLEALLRLLSEHPTALSVADGVSALASRCHMHELVKEWLTYALLLAPSTTQGLLQEYFRRVGTWQRVAHSSDIIALLSDIRLDTSNSNTATVPALRAAAAGGDTGCMEVLSIGITSANVKSNYAGEIAGMKHLFAGSLGGLTLSEGPQSSKPSKQVGYPSLDGFKNKIVAGTLQTLLIARFVQQIQQFLTDFQHGQSIDGEKFREACLQASALLLSEMGSCADGLHEGASQLLRLLCWCPAQVFTAEVMETGVFVWTWLLAAAPQLGSLVVAELVDAWLWTVASRRGLFAAGIDNSGPAADLRPQLTAGAPRPPPAHDPVRGITAHRIWLGFLLDRFEVVRHTGSDQLLLIARMMQGSMQTPSHFSSHPAAAGGFFTLLLLGLRLCNCLLQTGYCTGAFGANLLRDQIYRAAFAWFSMEPGWFQTNVEGMAQAEAEAVSTFAQFLAQDCTESVIREETPPSRRSSRSGPHPPASSYTQSQLDNHPVWGKENSDLASRERQKLLLVLCQHEADRLETWAYPLRDHLQLRFKSNSERWGDHARTAWVVDPRIALALVARFPGAVSLKAEVASLVQEHASELTNLPEALRYLVTPRAVEEDSDSLHWLPHWAPCSITLALEFLTPPYKGHHRVMAYVLRVMESYPPERVTFFMPQLVQALRYDHGGLVEGYLKVAAHRSNLFAHILIWQLQGEEAPPAEDAGKEGVNMKNALYEIVPKVRKRIIDSFTPEAFTLFDQEFRFFDKVTSISGVLYPLPKDARRAGIRRELEKIHVEGDELYLPTDPSKLVKGIEVDSGIPLQSAAKVPIMITFDVVDKEGDANDVKLQACIFKVGDDCRQDVLALQVIALLKDIWQAVGVNLYLFPYGVLPTGYGRGIIEVVPNTRSRNQMGEVTDGGLYELYQQEYGPVGSVGFETARDNFIVSSAGYAVASLLLQPKDRHNGNLLFDNEGRLVHIDFGFILETSPGGNMRFESAQFKLSHEMTQLLDPSGVMKSEPWNRFVRLCVRGYLAARNHMGGIVNTVLLMVDSGLPCFSRGDPIGNLRKRFHPEMSEREAANFMMKTCADAYNKWTTAGYDLIQYLQQGIER